MNTVLKYFIGLDLLLNCHAKISRRYNQPFLRKWRLKLLFLVFFRIFPNGNCHFLPGLWKAGCDVARLNVLQSYRSCTFCKRKTRGETQFWIEFAAPYTLANNNEMTSDDRLPFIIFLRSISCDGSNRLWRQRLLPSPCSLWRHKQTLVGVIRPLAGGKCRTFRRVTERYRFHRYLCFHCIRVRVFCILFCTNRVTISYQNCIHSNGTLRCYITVQLQRQYTCTSCWSYVCAQFHTFIYRSYRYKFHGHLIPSHIKRVVAEWL